MDELVAAALGSQAFREFAVAVTVKIVSEILSRRAADPAFLAISDQVFEAFSTAKTDEERQDAQATLQSLMSRPASSG